MALETSNGVLLVFEGKLPGLNDYTRACRTNPHVGAAMKKKIEKGILAQLYDYDGPTGIVAANVKFTWFEGNKRRDKDNIAFAKKFVLDALVSKGILKDDGWEGISSFRDFFMVEPGEERVEVEILW